MKFLSCILFLNLFIVIFLTPAYCKVIEYPVGITEIDSLVITDSNVVIKGQGMTSTILKIKNGIKISGNYPVIKDLCLVGSGFNTAIYMENIWSGIIENVRIENYNTGIWIELNENGRKSAGGKTQNGWPSITKNNEHFGSRVTLTNINNVQIFTKGDGVVLVNKLKKSDPSNYWKATNDNLPGEFFTGTTLNNGYIFSKGRALVIGDGVYSTKVIGTYFDVSDKGGIHIDENARGILIIGANLSHSSAGRKANSPLVVAPGRSRESLQIQSSIPKDIEKNYSSNVN